MPTGQALVNLLQTTGAITLSGGQKPTFKANFALLRAAFQPEQSAMLAAIRTALQGALAAGTPVSIPVTMKQRTDKGTISLTPPGGGAAVGIPVIILLGTDGVGSGPPTWPGVPRKGETVILDERNHNGHILIAAGGNGGSGSDGGAATAIGDQENLIVVLGGNGAPGGLGVTGSDGGEGMCQGIGSGNDLYAQGGGGGAGGTGAAGPAAVPGNLLVPPIPAGPGGAGGSGGNGGKAYVTGGDNSYGLAQGGNGGVGSAGGTGGAASPAITALGGLITTSPARPPGLAGRPGDGGDGGNYHILLGANSTVDPACSGGSPGTAAGVAGRAGTAGVKE